MKAYVGTKIIQAEPMDEATFLAGQGKGLAPTFTSRPGYKVVYPDGYVSWSPKDVFEQAYREVDPKEIDLICEADLAADKEAPAVGIQRICLERDLCSDKGTVQVAFTDGTSLEHDDVP